MPEKERQRGDGVERALGSAPLDRCYALAWILGSPQFACAPAPPEDDEGRKGSGRAQCKCHRKCGQDCGVVLPQAALSIRYSHFLCPLLSTPSPPALSLAAVSPAGTLVATAGMRGGTGASGEAVDGPWSAGGSIRSSGYFHPLGLSPCGKGSCDRVTRRAGRRISSAGIGNPRRIAGRSDASGMDGLSQSAPDGRPRGRT
jgi:hypothetical protein